MRRCSVCGQTKPFSDFYRDARRGYGARCKPCNAAQVSEYRRRNKEAINAHERQKYASSTDKWERHLKSKYGISLAKYAEMLEAQGGACGICKTAQEETLAVDHDHKTGAVRGLLCAKCNRMLGCASDSPSVLDAGAEYLRKHKGLL